MPNTNQLIRLLVPAPLMLEAALQYEGNAGLVAFHWTPHSGDITVCDLAGECSTRSKWDTWFLFIQHPAVSPFLSPFDLGGGPKEAKHWLLLDRKQRVFYVGTADQVKECLSANPPALPAGGPAVVDESVTNSITESQFEALTKAMADWDYSSPKEKQARDQRAVLELRHWLGALWQKMSVGRGLSDGKKP